MLKTASAHRNVAKSEGLSQASESCLCDNDGVDCLAFGVKPVSLSFPTAIDGYVHGFCIDIHLRRFCQRRKHSLLPLQLKPQAFTPGEAPVPDRKHTLGAKHLRRTGLARLATESATGLSFLQHSQTKLYFHSRATHPRFGQLCHHHAAVHSFPVQLQQRAFRQDLPSERFRNSTFLTAWIHLGSPRIESKNSGPSSFRVNQSFAVPTCF